MEAVLTWMPRLVKSSDKAASSTVNGRLATKIVVCSRVRVSFHHTISRH